ncbi:MAG: DUF2344 domain-containing protein [Pirellulaceae bacterium]|nr:DUF2344 domain-containing protein [Pirellulaceae bacterium]
MTKTRVRIHFTKTDDLRWISHRDLARTWERLLRRAGLNLAFSEGFHPKPKISFPSALALGIVALEEIVEMDLVGPVDVDQARQSIEQQMPAGMQLLSLTELPPGAGKALMIAASYEVQLSQADALTVRQQLERLLADGQIKVLRDGKTLIATFGDPLLDITCEGDVLRFTLPTTAAGSLRPSELLEALSIAHVLPEGAVLTRTRVHWTAHSGTAQSGTAQPGAAQPGAASGSTAVPADESLSATTSAETTE